MILEGRDHNRLAGGGAVVKSEPLAKLQSTPAPRAPPPVAAPKTDALLPQLKHAAAGFEALSVLVHYLVYDLDAFSTQRLKDECNSMKAEWLRTKLDLEELQASYGRMQDMIVDERTKHRKELDELTECQQQALLAAETKSNQERSQLVDRYETRLADFDKRFQKEREETQARFVTERSQLEKAHAERVAELLRDIEQIREEHTATLARLQDDHKHVEGELRTKMNILEADNLAMKEQACKLMDSMKKDKDTKLQATAARCRELQDEVHSLQTVLELKHNELQELRRQNAKLTREADQLPGALQRNAALEARVEDLQEQLTVKASYERQLSEEHRRMVESLQQEAKQKNRLSLHNEELQWKLKQNSEVVNVLAALNGAAIGSPVQLPSSPASSRRSAHGSVQSLTDISRSSRSGCRLIDSASQSLRSETEDPSSPPASPKIKAVVEKSDSVSWVLEMEETPDVLVSRLMRRAGSFRGTTASTASSISLNHSRTLPPPKRQRCKTSLSLSSSATSVSRQVQSMKSNGTTNGMSHSTSSIRSRSRSMSSDTMDVLDYSTWPNSIGSTPVHQSLQMQRCNNEGNDKSCGEIIMTVKNTGKNPLLKRCGDQVDVVLHDDELLDESLGVNRSDDLHKWNTSASECSNDDSPTKSSSSSASSSSNSSPSSDGSIRSSGGAGGGSSDREYRHRKKSSSKLLMDASDARRTLDLVEADVLPLPPLPSSNNANSDLSLLAACAAAQPALMPKESAGEAMISEETSEDENDHDVVSSSDERSCSQDEDDEESTSESSSGLRL
ncbi:uncharacterized protein [Anabrus simplex]|uniref:uncharacterized protein n=1 Tax=Anabrus simplex TaxID=316456 RepID=UPI0034DCF24E